MFGYLMKLNHFYIILYMSALVNLNNGRRKSSHRVDAGKLLIEQPRQRKPSLSTVARLDPLTHGQVDLMKGEQTQHGLTRWICPVLLALREHHKEHILILGQPQSLSECLARTVLVRSLNQAVFHTVLGAAERELDIRVELCVIGAHADNLGGEKLLASGVHLRELGV